MDSAATNQIISGDDVELELEYEIEEDIEAELEDFVRLSHMGQFKAAHELFDECLSEYDGWYPIAAEYADCLLREGAFEELAAFSEMASMKFQDPSEIALLELMEGIGCLLPRDVMWRRLQEIWPDLSLRPPYTSLRDTDIHLLEIVLQILVFSRLQPEDLGIYSDSDLSEDLGINSDSDLSEDLGIRSDSDLAPSRPWGVFQDWFYCLLRQEYFWEAQRILHSLFHELPRLECLGLVHDYLSKALSTNIDQESVQISVSSVVQHFMYAFRSIHPSPLAVVQWNDAMHWALFGVTLAKPSEESTSLLNRICLRRSLRAELELKEALPLNGANYKNETEELLHEAAMSGDTAMMQAVFSGPTSYTLDELNGRAFSSAAPIYSHHLLPFLNPETVDGRDGYQRTPLHWASLIGQGNAVETLLTVGEADTSSLDWFGCTPLHYGVRSCLPGSETEHFRIIKLLLMSDSANVNTRDSCGLTPLYMAIVNQSYGVAEILLEHNAKVETSDFGALLLLHGGTDTDLLLRWKGLLSQYDDSRPVPLDLEAITHEKTSLSYPGTIHLDTGAALALRFLPQQAAVNFLPNLLSFLECDFSGSAFPNFQSEDSHTTCLTDTARLPKLVVPDGSHQSLHGLTIQNGKQDQIPLF